MYRARHIYKESGRKTHEIEKCVNIANVFAVAPVHILANTSAVTEMSTSTDISQGRAPEYQYSFDTGTRVNIKTTEQ
jgi:hypothetical protein